MKDFLSAVIVMVLLLCIVLFTKKIFKKSTAEQSRKLIHVSMGVITLFFPYLFDTFIPVVMLGLVAFISLLVLRKNTILRTKFGDGLFSIDRKSYGEIYFVISIVLIFSLYKIMNLNVVHYIIPIATLTFADSTAALIGVRYGQNKLSGEYEDTKSLEGSVIFFIVAFMCSLFPLQLMTTVGRLEVLLISIFVGLLSAMVEMTSHDGNDNFLLPFLTFLIVQYNFNEHAGTLMYMFFVVFFIVFVCSIINKSTSLSKLAIVSVLLYGYMTMILGSLNWLYIPLLVFAFFSILPRTTELEKKNTLNYQIIEHNILVGTIFVFIKSITGLRDVCFCGFMVAYCMTLTMNTYVRLNIFYRKNVKVSSILSIIKTILVIEIPYILFNAYYYSVYRWWDWIIILTCTVISVFIIQKLNKKFDYSIINVPAAKANMFSVAIVSGIVFLCYITLGGMGCIVLS